MKFAHKLTLALLVVLAVVLSLCNTVLIGQQFQQELHTAQEIPFWCLVLSGLLPFILFFPFLSVKKCRSLPAGGKARLYFRKRLSRRKTGNRRRADLGFCRAAEYRVRFPARAVRLAEGGIVLFFVFVPLLSACS